jgi:hypothetical protein
MLDSLDEVAGPDLDAARAKIKAVRDALQAALDAHGEEVAEIGQLAAGVRRAEEAVSTGVSVS